MNNGDKLAFPFEGGANNRIEPSVGLNKREYFAAMAMQGIISAVLAGGCNPVSYTEIAKDAITAADELLKAIGDL